MNIERTAKRFLAIYGWQPVGVMLAVFLLFALVVDHYFAEYRELSEQSASLDKKVRDMKAKVGQQKKLEAVLKDKQAELAKQREKCFAAATPDQAGTMLLDEVRRLATVSRAAVTAGNVLPPGAEDGFAILRAESELNASTQQLVGFLESAANSPKGMRIDTLKVNVQNPEQPALLAVKLAVQSFYVEPVKGAR